MSDQPAAEKKPAPKEPGPSVYPIVFGFGGLDEKTRNLIMDLMHREAKLRDPKIPNPLLHRSSDRDAKP